MTGSKGMEAAEFEIARLQREIASLRKVERAARRVTDFAKNSDEVVGPGGFWTVVYALRRALDGEH